MLLESNSCEDGGVGNSNGGAGRGDYVIEGERGHGTTIRQRMMREGGEQCGGRC